MKKRIQISLFIAASMVLAAPGTPADAASYQYNNITKEMKFFQVAGPVKSITYTVTGDDLCVGIAEYVVNFTSEGKISNAYATDLAGNRENIFFVQGPYGNIEALGFGTPNSDYDPNSDDYLWKFTGTGNQIDSICLGEFWNYATYDFKTLNPDGFPTKITFDYYSYGDEGEWKASGNIKCQRVVKDVRGNWIDAEWSGRINKYSKNYYNDNWVQGDYDTRNLKVSRDIEFYHDDDITEIEIY